MINKHIEKEVSLLYQRLSDVLHFTGEDKNIDFYISSFKEYLFDSTEYSINIYERDYNSNKYHQGFILYRKYSRKDVFRILNWDKNPVAQNVGGYIISKDKTNCPIFVNYHKHENISSTTKYEDIFLNNSDFQWMSKSNRTLKSPDVVDIKNHDNKMRIPLFIKKSNDEGLDFYYMGDVTPDLESFKQTSIEREDNKPVPIVKLIFKMNEPVKDSIFNYIISEV